MMWKIVSVLLVIFVFVGCSSQFLSEPLLRKNLTDVSSSELKKTGKRGVILLLNSPEYIKKDSDVLEAPQLHDTLFLKYHPIYERIWRNAPLYKDGARINEIKRLELEFDVIALGMTDKDIRGILGEPSKEFDVIFREEDQFVWWDYTGFVDSGTLPRLFERNDEIKKLFRMPLKRAILPNLEEFRYYSNIKTVGQRFVYYQKFPQIMFYYRLIEIPDISGLTEKNINSYPRLPKKITSILINMLDMKSFEIPYIGNQPFMGIHGSGNKLGSVEKYNR